MAKDLVIEPEALKQMRERGGKWSAYQNVAIDSANAGHIQFLQYGEGRTFQEPPERMPDTSHGLGWRYRLCGLVNLETGEIIPVEMKT